MAVVRFSDELKNAITDNAKALFSKRIQDAFKALPPIAEEVCDLAYAQFMPSVNMLPRDFFRWTTRVEIKAPCVGGYIEATYESRTPYPKVESRIKLDDGVLLDSMYGITIKLPSEGTKYQQYIDQIIAWHQNIKAFEKQRDEFVSGVKAVVEAHSTLAPALKAWPPLWDLVPETFRERHRKVVERAKPAAAAELDVDLTSLTAAVTIAKITR
jgi:hypothetical protein